MYNEQFPGEGFPAWAVDDNGLPAFPQLGFSANYFLQPALQAAYGNFWANAAVDGKGLQDWFAGAWQHVAAYFDGSPYVLGYDLFNEPSPGSGIYCYCGDPTTSSSSEGLVNDAAAAPTGSNVNTGMLDALAVPHPELVAGTPASYGYDTSTSVFTLTYSTGRAGGAGAFPAGRQRGGRPARFAWQTCSIWRNAATSSSPSPASIPSCSALTWSR